MAQENVGGGSKKLPTYKKTAPVAPRKPLPSSNPRPASKKKTTSSSKKTTAKPAPKKTTAVAKKPVPKVVPASGKKPVAAPAKKTTPVKSAPKPAAKAPAKPAPKPAPKATASKPKSTPASKSTMAPKSRTTMIVPKSAQSAPPKTSPLQALVDAAKKNTSNLQNEYKNSTNVKNAQGMINATIEDIQKKYGFDFSREYAARQAEVEAQAKRDAYNGSIRENKSANELIMDTIEANLREGNTALDHSSFQDFMKARQGQSDRGLNAGIAAEQDLRLGMNQQAQMANLYRDASTSRNQENNRFSNESLRLNEALKLVEQQKLAQEESMFQELRGKAFDVISKERSQGLEIDSAEWRKIQDRIANSTDLTRIDADRIAREAELTGNYGGNKTAAQIAEDFRQRMAEQELALSKDKFSWEKQMEEARLKLAQQQAAAARQQSSYRPSGTTTSQTASAQQIVDAAKMKAIREQQGQMSTASPKLNPSATTGLASKPGSYWYARGYGNQYNPNNYRGYK